MNSNQYERVTESKAIHVYPRASQPIQVEKTISAALPDDDNEYEYDALLWDENTYTNVTYLLQFLSRDAIYPKAIYDI